MADRGVNILLASAHSAMAMCTMQHLKRHFPLLSCRVPKFPLRSNTVNIMPSQLHKK